MSDSYLVTGAAGFIGSHVAETLLVRGDEVVGLDVVDDYYAPGYKRANLSEIAGRGDELQFEFVEGDIRDTALLRRIFRSGSFKAVVHLAARPGVRASMAEPHLYFDVNVGGTLALLECLNEINPAPNFVFTSTSSVYGATRQIPFVESDPCDRPLVPYSASKRAAELLCHSYHYLYQLNVTILRLFTVYGPRNRPDMLAGKILAALESGSEILLYEGGHIYRDWTFVDDAVAAIVSAIDRPLGFDIINVGRGEPVKVADFVSRAEIESGRMLKKRQVPLPKGDMQATHADISRARRLLSYEPQVALDEGVKKMVEWERTRRNARSGTYGT